MRSITGTAARVPTLFDPKGKGKSKAEAIQTVRETNPTAKVTFSSHWNEPDVRGALYAQQGKVCAYCGCSLPRNDRGDVEHYRPKGEVDGEPEHGGYWWLAYEFSNYVLSCSTCNRNLKKSKFPLRPNAKRVVFQDRSRLPKEARLLLDPLSDPLEDLVRVNWQDPLCPLEPAQNITGVQRTQVEGMLAFFRINTDARLVDERLELRDRIAELLDEGKTAAAARFAIRYLPHSLVARQILADLNVPNLPDGQAEFEALLDDLINDLKLTLEIMARLEALGDEDDKAADQAEELVWALTVLAAAPPTPVDLRARLNQMGLPELVTLIDERLPELI